MTKANNKDKVKKNLLMYRNLYECVCKSIA